jgi:hypothetical protein
MRTVEEQLAREETLIGYPVKYRNAWETEFRGQDDELRKMCVLVYDVEPHEVMGFRIEETRWVYWDASGTTTGGIVQAES